MRTLEKTPDLIDFLYTIDTFAGIERSVLEWLVEKSEYVLFKEGEYIFQANEPALYMQIIVEGYYDVWIDRNGERQEMGGWEAGYITGLLPFSRMKTTRAVGLAKKDTKILQLHKDYFVEMVNVSFELTQELVGFMSNRIREFSSLRMQNEKLMALGKLSAGLAHELNNPSSAIVRSARELYQRIHQTPERFKSVITMRITPEETDEINKILFSRLENPPEELSILDRQDALDDVIDWLEDQDIEDGDDLAETFVDYGISVDLLDNILGIIGDRSLPPILWWLESTLSLEKLVNEIQESADRIAELVSSVKKYTHMDRGVAQEHTDIKEGIVSTVIMLKHKIKEKQIQVEKQFDPDLPRFKAFVGQLNQVWTNLIANAIDAMDKGGTLKIKTYRDDEYICVDINDDGHGIPPEIMDQIFDSFFTTKTIANGSGMGLDITKKIVAFHNGTIRVDSQPGDTTFKVCLPLEAVQ